MMPKGPGKFKLGKILGFVAYATTKRVGPGYRRQSGRDSRIEGTGGMFHAVKQRASLGWGSLLALVLLGLLPLGSPTRGSTDRALGQATREGAPLNTAPAGLRRVDLAAEAVRPHHAAGAALAALPGQLALRLVALATGSITTGQSIRPTPVAFPYFPTGPPIRS